MTLDSLRQQVQQAREDYYEQALDHGELSGHEEQEARAYGRVEMCDEVLGLLAGTPADGGLMVKLKPVCRSCGVQLVTGHKDDPAYHWEWCRRKTLRGRLGRGNAALSEGAAR